MKTTPAMRKLSSVADSDEQRKGTMRMLIEPSKGWQILNIQELRRYKAVFYFLVLRDITVLYKQTVLGYAWAVLRPLLSMVIFSVIFGRLAKMPSDGIPYPVFSYVALLPWTYFSSALTAASTSLLSDTKLFTKVYFPRLIIPLTPVVAKLVDFGISFVILGGMMLWYHIAPTRNLIFLPFLIADMILIAAAAGLWMAASSIQYRDIKHASPFIIQLLMYAAPVVWPASLVPERFRLLYGLYPMAGIIEGFRSALIGTNPMPWDLILVGTISALALFFTGALYFHRKEDIFADVV